MIALHKGSIFRRCLGGAALALIVAATTAGSALVAASDAAAEVVLNRGNRGEPASLDPHRIVNSLDEVIATDLFEGLVTFDARNNIIPGAAEKWEISGDGKTYTFTLRENLKWSDGEPLTAEDFVFSFRRHLDPATGGDAALLYPLKNAEKINSGEIADLTQLGVSAPDDRTVVLELEAPAGYFLSVLAQRWGTPVPRHQVEAKGDAWARAGEMATNGAFVATEWVPKGHVKAVKNPNFHAAGDVAIDTIYYHPLADQSAALNRFRAGEIDVNYGTPSGEMQWLFENMPNETRMQSNFAIRFIAINNQKITDARVRRALSMAVDNSIITDKVLRTGEKPSTSYIPEGLPDYKPAQLPYLGMSMDERIAEARRLMEEAGYGPNNKMPLSFRIKDRESWKRESIAIIAMWNQIHVDARQQVADSATHDAALGTGDFEVAYTGWVGRYPDPDGLLNYFESSAGSRNWAHFRNEEYDELLRKARVETDPARRLAILHEADTLLLKEAAIIPIYPLSLGYLVQQNVQGWHENLMAIHPTRFMSIAR